MYKVEYIIAPDIKTRASQIEQKANEMETLGYEWVAMSGTTEIVLVFKKREKPGSPSKKEYL